MRIKDNLYLYFWRDQKDHGCNTVVIDGKVPLIIDPGYIRHAEGLFGAMAEDGIDPWSVKAVILTHGHPDHSEAASLFQKGSVKIGGAKQDEHLLAAAQTPIYVGGRMIAPETRLDFHLRDGDLTLGKHEFKIFRTAGHTPGSISIYWPATKTLISGDLLFMRSVGRFDTPGGSGRELAQSIERMSRLEVDFLIPGHGNAPADHREVRACFDYVKTYVIPEFMGRSKN